MRSYACCWVCNKKTAGFIIRRRGEFPSVQSSIFKCCTSQLQNWPPGDEPGGAVWSQARSCRRSGGRVVTGFLPLVWSCAPVNQNQLTVMCFGQHHDHCDSGISRSFQASTNFHTRSCRAFLPRNSDTHPKPGEVWKIPRASRPKRIDDSVAFNRDFFIIRPPSF